MTSFASSAASAWSQGEDGTWRSCTGSAQIAVVNATDETDPPADTAVWFYSNARHQLTATHAAADGDAGGAVPYGTAAATLRQRPRPATADAATTVGFDVIPCDVMISTVGRRSAESNRRFARPRQRPRISISPAHGTVRSAGNSVRVTEGSLTSQDAVGRLMSVLNDCDAQQQQLQEQQEQRQRRTSAGRKGLHPSYENSYTANSFPTPHAPSDRSYRDSAGSTMSAHLEDLTRRWVLAEAKEEAAEAAAAATAQRAGSAGEIRSRATVGKMPAYRTVPAQAATPVHNSCVMRLRKCKFRPSNAAAATVASPPDVVAETATPSVASTEHQKKLSTEAVLGERLSAEPVRSYCMLRDATTPSIELRPSSQIPLLRAARLRRANLERLQHNFEHQRYVLHTELEDALEWREQCQAAVLRRRSIDSGAALVPVVTPPNSRPVTSSFLSSKPATDIVSQRLLDEVFTRPSKQRPHTAGEVPVQLAAVNHRSAWTTEAARRALREEKERLTSLLNAFEVTCGAAALTLVAMGEFRAETITRVWHPEKFVGNRRALVFTREHFLRFAQTRYSPHLPTLSKARAARRAYDILDALPSKAEASFAKYAYELLPSSAASV
ncbi:hypothetical protein ABB37_00743 [Leptomonas pyrrhocoris]|uniref:Uncharacterized protein n=1 Tax=Leptomonas pyrrhocoris TaxID=157538 RepID=A0A0M9GB30_LEPPY|nr:hypothetical protein ABB37_00743 [Leptomonas pyrrhocoris]KPA86637.1 hypothetical protein ABB37_00743 [Leptomonas pyrrhocoris]|eukprot:XP_015665076.1 hypothetical protein ABB37_00743 [Leptomonas pyrrhocoris]